MTAFVPVILMKTEATMVVEIKSAVEEDMIACGNILNDWIDETPWMPRVHPHDDVLRHYVDFVYSNRCVLVAKDSDGFVQGFSATSSDGFVTGLYVAKSARKDGLGSRLLDSVKQDFSGGVSLWTFVANTDAQKFYSMRGFHEVRRTDGDNEENLPDILFSWKPSGVPQ